MTLTDELKSYVLKEHFIPDENFQKFLAMNAIVPVA